MSGYDQRGYKADYENIQTQSPTNFDNDYY